MAELSKPSQSPVTQAQVQVGAVPEPAQLILILIVGFRMQPTLLLHKRIYNDQPGIRSCRTYRLFRMMGQMESSRRISLGLHVSATCI